MDEVGVSTSRATMQREILEIRCKCCILKVKPLMNQRQWQRRLTWAGQKKTVPESGRREEERNRIHLARSPVWGFSQWFGGMSPDGVCLLCFLKFTVDAANCQEMVQHFMPTSADWSLVEMLISFSSRTLYQPSLPKVPRAGSMPNVSYSV